MTETYTPDLCVIGGGSGGLSVAAGASQMGASVVLVERAKMGGDCLNYGCVPSKSMIAAAGVARSARTADTFGIKLPEPVIDFEGVAAHVKGVIDAIAPNDSVARFEGLGVKVVKAHARFTGPAQLVAGHAEIRARRYVIATGSAPAIPPIEGLSEVPYLTNETVFENTIRPKHLIVIGGGPIGSELAQAHRRLGCRVTIIEMFSVLGRDDPELAEVVRNQMLSEGIIIHEGVRVVSVANGKDNIAVVVEKSGKETNIEGTHLLVAAGRSPNISDLGLEEAGIAHDRRGIGVDARLRTSNKRVFAIGDVAGSFQFTHVAGYHAGIVIRNALFRLPAKVDYRAVPWVTYTDPELAHVGLDETAARERHTDIRILRHPFAENDRAQAERSVDGMVKVITTRRGVVLGATIVGAHAGELIQSWILPVQRRMKIGKMAGLILPYPTLGEVNKRVAGNFFIPGLFSDRTRKLVRLLSRLP